MEENLVSIVTPVYNCSEYIEATIQSVISQTYQFWEMLIVDDCSTDNSFEVIQKFLSNDKRIKYYKLEKNSGTAIARNVAMEKAKGQYMAFLDSDDLWMPEKLERQLAFMKKNGYAFTSTSYDQIDSFGNPRNKTIKAVKKVDYNRLLLDCPIGNSSVMYDVSKMGKFEVPNIRKRNDDALWLKMLKTEKYIMGLPDVLMQYRIRPNSISTNKIELIGYHWFLYRKIEHLSILRSSFHICYWCLIKVLKIK